MLNFVWKVTILELVDIVFCHCQAYELGDEAHSCGGAFESLPLARRLYRKQDAKALIIWKVSDCISVKMKSGFGFFMVLV